MSKTSYHIFYLLGIDLNSSVKLIKKIPNVELIYFTKQRILFTSFTENLVTGGKYV